MNENINNVQEAAAKEKSIVNGNGQGAVAEAAREEKEMPNQGAASETLDTGQGIEGNPVEIPFSLRIAFASSSSSRLASLSSRF